MANQGPDRTPRPWIDWPNEPSGYFEVAQRAIGKGKFLTADLYDKADEIARQHSTRARRIEVLRPDLLGLVRARARLDAIFRVAFRLSLWAHKNLGSAFDDRLFMTTDSIIDAADKMGDDPFLDQIRLRALRSLNDFVEERGLPKGQSPSIHFAGPRCTSGRKIGA